jgi:antitoxin (DNA-binding transcriptional repressor) of toxin-antitoxin stability system
MKFVTIRDFRNKTAAIRKSLETEHEMVMTANGRPFAILASVDEDTFEEKLKALRGARARILFDRISARAKARGKAKMTMREIDAEIALARTEQAQAEKKRPLH